MRITHWIHSVRNLSSAEEGNPLTCGGESKGDPPPCVVHIEPLDAGEGVVGIGSAKKLERTQAITPHMLIGSLAVDTTFASTHRN